MELDNTNPSYIIKQFDKDGKMVLCHEGPTEWELYNRHIEGKCYFNCGFYGLFIR